MRALAVVIGGTALILIGSAVLAPWLFWLAQAFPGVLPAKAVHGPFHQYIIRSMLICAVLGLFIIRYLAFNSWQQLGLRPPRLHWRELVAGFCWTFLLLSVLAAIVVIAGARAPSADLSAGKLLARLATAVATALIVAFLEELLFRGALFGGLRRAWSMPAALLVSSMIYAILHFPHRTEVLTEVTWYTGFLVLPQMLRGFLDLQHIMPGFLFLTAAGMIFGLAYYRTGALYASMGLHAGAIVVIKLYGSSTKSTGVDPWLWGTDKLTDGWLPLAYILLLLVVFPRLPLGQASPPTIRASADATDPALAGTGHRKP
jgi:CAAX protease family protein